jgi:proteic killer suppression protein
MRDNRSRGFALLPLRPSVRLQILDSAASLQDLSALPSNRFEALRGDRRGQFSIRLNRQWRICFRWGVDGPFDVAIVDYH